MPRQNKIILRNGTAAPSAGDFDVAEPAWDATNGKLYVKSSDATMVEVGGLFTGGTLTSGLVLASGTTSLSPLTLQSGTNLTTATAGSVEYDGKVIYSTPSGRGVSPSMMIYRLNSDVVGNNATGSQSSFGVGVTLQSSTVYAFDLYYYFQKTAGTSIHNFSILFGGTATLNNFFYQGVLNGANFNDTFITTSTSSILSRSSSLSVLRSSISSANSFIQLLVSGSLSVNSGGTFIPQYQLSAAPGGAYSTKAGSYMALWPIGASGTNTSVGPWA